MAILTIVSFPLTYIVAKISSVFVNDPRPFVVEHTKPLISHVADNGFPSDHVLLAMAITVVIFTFHKKLGIALFVITILIGAARVAAGVHHPLDIFGSMVIAIFVTATANYLLPIVYSRFTKNS